jgi:hypothetical protein
MKQVEYVLAGLPNKQELQALLIKKWFDKNEVAREIGTSCVIVRKLCRDYFPDQQLPTGREYNKFIRDHAWFTRKFPTWTHPDSHLKDTP